MGIRKVNILTVALDESLDVAGFRHAAATVGGRLGARRIGASVYQADAGVPIWPYHYHHGIEEWLYVVAGAPELRDPAGERTLTPGDLVCFPSGHRGAHTPKGAGRFVIFSTGHDDGPYLSVYPDSDKVSGPQGIFVRASAVGYWHGEGTQGASEPVEIVREPERSPPQPVVDVPAIRPQPGAHGHRATSLGRRLAAERLDAALVELAPGEVSEDYHCVFGQEQWVLVLAGTPAVRHPHGEDSLEAGGLVCFPDGPDGAHQLLNRGDQVVRALLLSTTGLPAGVYYPDTGLWLLRNGSGQREVTLRECRSGEGA